MVRVAKQVRPLRRPYAKLDEAGSHGRLLQYCSVTEAPDFGDDADACVEWVRHTTLNVEG